MLVLDKVTYTHKRCRVFDNVSMEIAQKEVVGIVCPSQLEKSIVGKVITGLIVPDQGKVLLDGGSIHLNHTSRRNIGYQPEVFGGYEYLTSKEYLEFYGNLYGLKKEDANHRVKEILQYIEMLEYEESYVESLSRAERLKLSIGRALINQPKLLVVEEIVNGLNPASRVEIQSLLSRIRQSGLTIVFIACDLSSLMKNCNRIMVLGEGKIVANGSEEEILRMKQSANPILIRIQSGLDTAIKILRNNHNVVSLSRKDNVISVRFQGESGEEAELLSELIGNHVEVVAFYREESDFDSFYMELIRK